MTRIPFILLSTSDGSPLTGASPTVTISKDGAAFASATNSPAEIGNGYYYVDLTTAETTVTNNVIVRATATGAQPTAVVWEPEQDLSGLSTFDPLTDTVTIDATQAATIATAAALATVGDNVSAVKAKTDNLPASPAATGDAMTLTSAYDAAKTASQFDASTDTVTLASASITAVQSGLSTFDASTDTVTIDSDQAATMVTADVSGLATQTDISDAVTDLENYGQEHWQTTDVSELATSSELATATESIVGAMPTGYATPNDIPTADITAIKAGLYNWELVKDGSTESITAKSGSSTVAQSTITRNSAGEIIKMEETE